MFLEYLNNHHNGINFTRDIKSHESSSPCLDVFVSPLPNGRLSHSIFQKSTHPDQIHPAANALVNGTVSHLQPENLQIEL